MMCASDYIYLDYNASAPVRRECFEMVQQYKCDILNPSAIHKYGKQAKNALERARDSLFDLLKISRVNYEIVFTSGATEANNWVIQSFDGPILVSSIEHASILNVKSTVDIVSVDAWGQVEFNKLEEWLSQQSKPSLVCIMYANNETGVVQDVDSISKICQKYGAYFHCDAVQILGKRVIDFSLFSSCSLSAHKIGGFGGIGCCVIQKNWELPSLLKGGGQEQYRRSGTENLIGALSFSIALEKALEEQRACVWDDVKNKRDRLENLLLKVYPDVYVAGRSDELIPVDRLENTSLICLPDIKSENQVIYMDLNNIAVSAGAACSSGRLNESHVLKAMGVSSHLTMGSLRVSMGATVLNSDIDRFFDVWCQMAEKFGAIVDV